MWPHAHTKTVYKQVALHSSHAWNELFGKRLCILWAWRVFCRHMLIWVHSNSGVLKRYCWFYEDEVIYLNLNLMSTEKSTINIGIIMQSFWLHKNVLHVTCYTALYLMDDVTTLSKSTVSYKHSLKTKTDFSIFKFQTTLITETA